MTGFLTVAALFFSLLAFMSVSGCEYLETEDEGVKILEPPSVREIIGDAKELSLGPVDLLARRRAAAHEDLEDFYLDRMDEAPNDRAITRLKVQLDRARAPTGREL